MSQDVQDPAQGKMDPHRFKEAVILMGVGVLLGVMSASAFKKVEGFRCFSMSVAGVIAGRGLVRFFFG